MPEEAPRPSSVSGSQGEEEEEEDLIEIDEEPCDNVAFIFLKPTAQTDSVKALLDKLLRDRSIEVLSSGETTCQHAVEKGVIEKHHSVKARFANKTPSARVRHPGDIEESFVKHLGGKYADLTKAGTLISAVEAMEKFKCTAQELNDLWLLPDNGPLLNITFELDVRKITSKEGVYVINGYYPALQASLSDPKDKIIWYSVSWPEVSLTWAAFRTDVIGHRDPSKAKPGSFRAILNEEWSSLGLTAAPTMINNGIHCSSSPLEALVGRSLWADVPFGKDPLGMIIRERYSDNGVELCRQWSENNRISINGGAFLPTYQEVMDNQTSDFLDAIGQNVANDEAFLLFRAQRKADVDKKKGTGAEGGDAFGEDAEEKADGPGAEEKAVADDSNTAKTEDTNVDKSVTKEGEAKDDGKDANAANADANAEDGDATTNKYKADDSIAAKADDPKGADAEQSAAKADENSKEGDSKGDESNAGKKEESAAKEGDSTNDESNNNVAIGSAVGAGAVVGAAVVGGVAVAAASGAKEGEAKDTKADATAAKADDSAKEDGAAKSKDHTNADDSSAAQANEPDTVKSEGASDEEGDAPPFTNPEGSASTDVKRKGRGGIGFAESSVNASSPSKTLHSRKSFIRVSSIAADDGDRWTDTEFKEQHDDMCDGRWARIDSLYPGPKPGDSLLPTGMCIEHVAHGTMEDSFFYVSLSALLSHPGLVQNAFLTKEVRKDGRYTFQFYRWERWEKVEIDDTIMLNEEGQTIFCYSPTNHWWPLLLEKAYAKFYKSYDNILNGSVVEAMHDFTSKPVINMGLNEDLRMRINFQSVRNWRELGTDLAANKYAATVVAMLKDEDMEESNTGIRAADSYGVRRIVELPKTAAAKDEEEEVDEDGDYDHILVELYCPYRKSEYTGPWATSDSTRWTEDAIRLVNPVFKREAPPASDNNQASVEHRQLIANTIYVPLSLILSNFKSLQLCYLGAVKPKPFYYTDEWTKETAGGNANFAQWRSNPKYVAKNDSSNPITIIATIKQQDQRSRIVEGNEEDIAIKYLSCGMTLVQQNPPAAPPREAPEEDSDTEAAPVDTTPPPLDHYINTPFITSATCKFLHRGVYINQREVSNEIVLPPHSLCYLLPATIDAGTIGSFMLTVFVPDEAGETDVTVGPIEPYVRIDRPLECSFMMKASQRVKLSLNLDTTLMRAFDPVKGAAHYERAEIHVLLRQEKEVTKEGVIGDTVMEEYFALALHDPYNTRLPGSMTSALNYKETSLLFRATCTKGTYTVVAICAKALSPEEELPVTVTVLLPSECMSEGAALTIQTNPPQKPLEEDDEDFPTTLPDEGAFGEFTTPTKGASPTREHPQIRSNSLRERPERRRSSQRSSITPGNSKSPAPPPPTSDKNPRNSPQPVRSDGSSKASSPTAAEPIAPKAPAGKKPAATKGPSPKVSATKTVPPKKSAPAASSARPKVPPAKK